LYYKRSMSESATDIIDQATGLYLTGRDEPLGCIDLKSVYRVEPCAPEFDERGVCEEWGFVVSTLERKYTFFVDSGTERALWLFHIADMVKTLPMSRFHVRIMRVFAR
jgi:hypothetical protein